MTRCLYCPPGVDAHRPDGSFDAARVPVFNDEITEAIKRHLGGRDHDVHAPDVRARTRFAIALGKHSGTYERRA